EAEAEGERPRPWRRVGHREPVEHHQRQHREADAEQALEHEVQAEPAGVRGHHQLHQRLRMVHAGALDEEIGGSQLAGEEVAQQRMDVVPVVRRDQRPGDVADVGGGVGHGQCDQQPHPHPRQLRAHRAPDSSVHRLPSACSRAMIAKRWRTLGGGYDAAMPTSTDPAREHRALPRWRSLATVGWPMLVFAAVLAIAAVHYQGQTLARGPDQADVLLALFHDASHAIAEEGPLAAMYSAGVRAGESNWSNPN